MCDEPQECHVTLGGPKKMSLRYLSNSSMLSCAPVFLDGGSVSAVNGGGILLACPYGERIRVFSMGLAEKVTRDSSINYEQPWRELIGHKNPICGLAADSLQQHHIHSVAIDELELLTWNIISGELLGRRTLNGKPLGLLVTKKYGLFVVLTSNKSHLHGSIWRLDGGSKKKPLVHTVQNDCRCWAVGAKDSFLATCINNRLQITLLPDGEVLQYKTRDEVDIQCVAAHPIEECVATGLANGRILLWWSFTNSKKTPIRSLLHWHSVEVICVQFSLDGASLFSGGPEAVLVKWNMTAEGLKADYLPRIGSQLEYITCAAESNVLAVSLAHNEVVAVDSNFKQIARLRGITHIFESKGLKLSTSCGLVVDPLSGAVVTNGFPGMLQCINIELDIALSGLDVTQENYLSVAPNKTSILRRVQVECVAFSFDTCWLATFERRDDIQMPEHRIRIWNRPVIFDANATDCKNGFVQHSIKTLAAFRHVRQLAFRPDTPCTALLASTLAGELIIWRCEKTMVAAVTSDSSTVGQEAPLCVVNWRQSNTLTLSPDHRGGPCAFNATGDTFVSGHGTQAAVWNWLILTSPSVVLGEVSSSQNEDLSHTFFWHHVGTDREYVVTCSPCGARVYPCNMTRAKPCVQVNLYVRCAMLASTTKCVVLLCTMPNAMVIINEADCANNSYKIVDLSVSTVAACVIGGDSLVCLTENGRLCVFESDHKTSTGALLRQAWCQQQLDARRAAVSKSVGAKFDQDNWLLAKLDVSKPDSERLAPLPRKLTYHRDLLLKKIEGIRTDQPFSAPELRRLVGDLLDDQLQAVLHLQRASVTLVDEDDESDADLENNKMEEDEEEDISGKFAHAADPASFLNLEQWDNLLNCHVLLKSTTWSEKIRSKRHDVPQSTQRNRTKKLKLSSNSSSLDQELTFVK